MRNIREYKHVLLSKLSEMVEVDGEEETFLVMKYPVTSALWGTVMVGNDYARKSQGASHPVEMMSSEDSRWILCRFVVEFGGPRD